MSKYADLPGGRIHLTAVVVLLLLSYFLWASPALWPSLFQHLAPSETHSPASISGTAGAGATGTLFSGGKQRAYTGARLRLSMSSGMQGTGGPSAHEKHKARRWAVVTTINPPTEAILGVAALPGWSVVVVGDVSSAPFNVSAENVVFLSAQAQQQLAAPYSSLTALLPWKHFGRKNIGFLYAILHGADMLWDFDDDNMLKPGHTPQLPTAGVHQVQMLSQHDCAAFNPYPHMGDPSTETPATPPAWPRGFPLDLIRSPCRHKLVASNTSRVAVLQSLADHDPDVDAIYRLTRGVPFSFRDGSRKTLIMPNGTLTPWNAQVGPCTSDVHIWLMPK